MSSVFLKELQDIFCSSTLSIIPTEQECNDDQLPTSSLRQISNRVYSTTAYFKDGISKRSKVAVSLLINFDNEFERHKLLKSGAIQPTPLEFNSKEDKAKQTSSLSQGEDAASNDDGDESGYGRGDDHDESDLWNAELDLIGETQDDEEDKNNGVSITFQCTCEDTEEEERTIVESVKTTSTSLVNSIEDQIIGIRFDVEIAIQSIPREHDIAHSDNADYPTNINVVEIPTRSGSKEFGLDPRMDADISNTQLEIRANLVCTNSDSNTYSSLYGMGNKSDKLNSRHRSKNSSKQNYVPHQKSLADIGLDDLSLGKQALQMGMDVISPFEVEGDGLASHAPAATLSYFSQSATFVLPPPWQKALQLRLSILPALFISVREINGAASNTGVTLVSLVMYHSNLHNENVTIESIALHPGHSRLFEHDMYEGSADGFGIVNASNVRGGRAMLGGENAVINMTKNVRWGYASGTAPSLPLVLKPQEAVATVIQINANEVMMERTFLSPICVRAVVGDISEVKADRPDHGQSEVVALSDTFRNRKGRNTSLINVTTDARWTTSPIAIVGTSDAFRITLSIRDQVYDVGAQVVVGLKVVNLSSEPRDLMLLMAKDSESEQEQNGSQAVTYAGGITKSGASTIGMSGASAIQAPPSQQPAMNGQGSATQNTPINNSINNAVVYEVSGYTFGCWGLSGNDDGTVRHTRDQDLLAVDAALLLGEVKGQLSVEAEVRFVPLREGTLSVPNLKLYDKITGKWYDCFHTLKIISIAKQ